MQKYIKISKKKDHPALSGTPPQRGILSDIGGFAKFPSGEGCPTGRGGLYFPYHSPSSQFIRAATQSFKYCNSSS